jgi:hypothetical protein
MACRICRACAELASMLARALAQCGDRDRDSLHATLEAVTLELGAQGVG